MGDMVKHLLVLLTLLGMGGGVAGCAAQQEYSGRYDTLKENTEVLEVRLTNFEERLALVEQEIGVLRSQGALPEGARWVDPAPSLSKVGALNAPLSHAPAPVSPTPSSAVPPAPRAVSPTPTAGQSVASPQGGEPSRLSNTSAMDQFIGGGTGQGVALGQEANTRQTSSQGMPSLTPLQAAGAAQGGSAVQDGRAVTPSPSVPKTVKTSPSASIGSGSLKGLPAGFRTGVRAYDEALAMYYRHEYSRSQQAFTAFIEGNKGHKLMANALYWQGESAYSQADYLGAILSFKSITSQFPKHAKSADALLKIGMSYERLKDPDNAQFYWQVLLDDFPKSSAARVARGKMPR